MREMHYEACRPEMMVAATTTAPSDKASDDEGMKCMADATNEECKKKCPNASKADLNSCAKGAMDLEAASKPLGPQQGLPCKTHNVADLKQTELGTALRQNEVKASPSKPFCSAPGTLELHYGSTEH